MSKASLFHKLLPGNYFPDPEDPDALETHLARNGRRNAGESFTAAGKAGEGNMHCTVRMFTSARTFIIEKSRPWLENYPQLAEPFDRMPIEGCFYRPVTAHAPVASWMPRLLAFSRRLEMELDRPL